MINANVGETKEKNLVFVFWKSDVSNDFSATEKNQSIKVPKMKLLFFYASLTVAVYVDRRNDYCYLKCGENHTVCARHLCKFDWSYCHRESYILTLKTQEVNLALNVYNWERNTMASGRHLRLLTGYELADMSEVVYSKELAFIAQCWANACRVHRDQCRSSPKWKNVGQSVYVMSDIAVGRSKIFILTAFYNWLNELDLLDNPDWLVYNDSVSRYGTMLSAASIFAMGCGRTKSGTNLYFVCNFAEIPRQGEPLFKKGPNCSTCNCSAKYKRLCKVNFKEEFDVPFILDTDFGTTKRANRSLVFLAFIFIALSIN